MHGPGHIAYPSYQEHYQCERGRTSQTKQILGPAGSQGANQEQGQRQSWDATANALIEVVKLRHFIRTRQIAFAPKNKHQGKRNTAHASKRPVKSVVFF